MNAVSTLKPAARNLDLQTDPARRIIFDGVVAMANGPFGTKAYDGVLDPPIQVGATFEQRLLGYRQSFRSLRTAKATLSGIETIRTIKRDHICHKQPGVRGEIEFIGRMFDAHA